MVRSKIHALGIPHNGGEYHGSRISARRKLEFDVRRYPHSTRPLNNARARRNRLRVSSEATAAKGLQHLVLGFCNGRVADCILNDCCIIKNAIPASRQFIFYRLQNNVLVRWSARNVGDALSSQNNQPGHIILFRFSEPLILTLSC